jgi:hypothetical protein
MVIPGKGAQLMKKMSIRLTSEQRELLKNALEKNASEITVLYEEELSEGQLDQVQGWSGRCLSDNRRSPRSIHLDTTSD